MNLQISLNTTNCLKTTS